MTSPNSLAQAVHQLPVTGIGLGLLVAREFQRLLGGDFVVDDADGDGTAIDPPCGVEVELGVEFDPARDTVKAAQAHSLHRRLAGGGLLDDLGDHRQVVLDQQIRHQSTDPALRRAAEAVLDRR